MVILILIMVKLCDSLEINILCLWLQILSIPYNIILTTQFNSESIKNIIVTLPAKGSWFLWLFFNPDQ